jgi:hypothetical protein
MSEPRTFSWIGIGLGSGVANAIINAPLGLLIVKHGALLPFWGLPSVAADVVAMAYGISFGTGLAVTLQTKRQVAKGQLAAPVIAPWLRSVLNTWPPGLLRRSIQLGIVSVPIFAPLPLLALWLFGPPAADQTTVVILKGAFSFVQGALVTPIIAAGAFFPNETTG